MRMPPVKVMSFVIKTSVVSALLGAAFGVVCFYAMPYVFSTKNIIEAILTGAASGLTATGADQMIKQMSKKEETPSSDPHEKEEDKK